MEDALNFKSLGKINIISNRTTKRNSNNKFEDSTGFNTKTNSEKHSSTNLNSIEYKKIIDICKRLKTNKKKKKKNIISIDESKS